MTEPDVTGWYIALIVGLGLILGVVVVLVVIMQLARTIGVRTREIAVALQHGKLNTSEMPDVTGINVRVHHVTTLLSQLRHHLESIHDGGPR